MMILKTILVLIVSSAATADTTNGLRILFPQQSQYKFSLDAKVTSGFLSTAGDTSWVLHADLMVQVFDNYTKARLQLDNLMSVATSTGGVTETKNPEKSVHLREPWEVGFMENGLINHMYVGDEPLWVTNIKRALSVNLQLTVKPDMYVVSEPCLHEACTNIYNNIDGVITKYTNFYLDSSKTESIWTSVPWKMDGPLSLPGSIVTSRREYKFVEDSISMITMNNDFQYRTQDRIIFVASNLNLTFKSYEAEIPHTLEKLNLTKTPLQYDSGDTKDRSAGILKNTQSKLKTKTFEILLKIARNGIDSDEIFKYATMSHYLDFIKLLNTMSRLTYESLCKIFDDLFLGTSYDLETARNIFLEALPHATSEAGSKFIKHLVIDQKDKLEDAALLSLIRKLPFNVAELSQNLLEELESFTKLGPDFHQEIRHAAILSYGTLLYRTAEANRVRQDYIDKMVVKYFRMYSDCPQYVDRMVWLQGLCNMGWFASSYTRIVFKDASRDPHERLWAALAGLPESEPYSILDMTLPVITNSTEPIQIRIAALNAFLSSNNILENDFLYIHEYIKNNCDKQLKKFWLTTLKSMENGFFSYRVASRFIHPHIISDLSDPGLLYWATNNHITTTKENGGGYLQFLTIGDSDTKMPAFAAAKFSAGDDRPYQFAIYLIVEGVATHIFKRMHNMNVDALKMEELIQELRNMDVKLQKSEEVHIDIVVTILEKTVYTMHFNTSRIDNWDGLEALKPIRDLLKYGSHINQQMVYYPSQLYARIPSELGMPISLEKSTVSFTSMRGNLTAPFTDGLIWNNDLHTRFQKTSVTSVSTFSPVLHTEHKTRIQQSMVAQFGIKLNISISTAEKFVEMTWQTHPNNNVGAALFFASETEMITPDGYPNTVYNVETNQKDKEKESDTLPYCEETALYDNLMNKLDWQIVNIDLEPPQAILRSIVYLFSPYTHTCKKVSFVDETSYTIKSGVTKITVQDWQMFQDELKFSMICEQKLYRLMDFSEPVLDFTMNTRLQSDSTNQSLDVTFTMDVPTPTRFTFSIRDYSFFLVSSLFNPYPLPYNGDISVNASLGNESNTEEIWFGGTYRIQPRDGTTSERVIDLIVEGNNWKMLTSEGLGRFEKLKPFTSENEKDYVKHLVVKEKDNHVSVYLNPQSTKLIEFDTKYIEWFLDSWTNLQILTKFGVYHTCVINSNTTNSMDKKNDASSYTEKYIIAADCSDSPRFAVINDPDGGTKVYDGGHELILNTTVNASGKQKHFQITDVASYKKITSKFSGVQVFLYDTYVVVLIPHAYMKTVCGKCFEGGCHRK